MGIGTLRQAIGPYHIQALPFNQTNLADANGDMEDWEASNILTPPMPWAGHVLAVSLYTNADLTGGVVTFSPTVNGTLKTALAAVLDDTNQEAYATVAPGIVTFSAGDNLGVGYTKTGTVAPTTTDVVGLLWVLLNHGEGS